MHMHMSDAPECELSLTARALARSAAKEVSGLLPWTAASSRSGPSRSGAAIPSKATAGSRQETRTRPHAQGHARGGSTCACATRRMRAAEALAHPSFIRAADQATMCRFKTHQIQGRPRLSAQLGGCARDSQSVIHPGVAAAAESLCVVHVSRSAGSRRRNCGHELKL